MRLALDGLFKQADLVISVEKLEPGAYNTDAVISLVPPRTSAIFLRPL
jgi:hypothetical protein